MSVIERAVPEIWVSLSLAQAEWVAQQISSSVASGALLVRVLLALGGQGRVTMSDLRQDPAYNDRNISQHLLIGLMSLGPFYDKLAHRVTDVAAAVEMNQSAIIRYLKAWVAVGVLEQDRKTHRYRLALRWRTERDLRPRVIPSPASAEQVT